MGTFSTSIIKSKSHPILLLSLGATIIISLVIVSANRVIAQSIETITQQRNQFNKSPQIALTNNVGVKCLISVCHSIAISEVTNKIYITNAKDGTVSIIDSNSGSAVKNIHIGARPTSIAADDINHRIYVLDYNSIIVLDGDNDSKIDVIPYGYGNCPYCSIGVDELSTAPNIYVVKTDGISVINGASGSKEQTDIGLGFTPSDIAVDSVNHKIYATNSLNGRVSVINGLTKIKEPSDIFVGEFPTDIAIDRFKGKPNIYVANSRNNSVSIINGTTDTVTKTIFSGREPSSIAVDSLGKIFILNKGNNTVSVINGTSGMKEPNDTVLVGELPTKLAVNTVTRMVYVVNNKFSTVSVVDGFSNNVAAGVTLDTHPAGSGRIMCDKKEYPTNIYLYVDAGTKCIAQPNKDFQFSGWVENLKGNSTIPIGDSSNLTVNRYGNFTANFKALPPAFGTELLPPLYGIIASSLLGWSIPTIMSGVKSKTQRKHLKECLNDIDKLDKNTLEEKITGYYVDGKISESHRELLKDKISEHYDDINTSGRLDRESR